MRLTIHHTTRYEFSEPVHYGLQRLRLKPKPTHGQTVLDWNMDLEGATFEAEYDDHHGNHVVLISVHTDTQRVSVSCRGEVDTADRAGIVGPHVGNMPLWCFLRPTPLTKPGPRVKALLSGVESYDGNRLEQLHALSRAVIDAVPYQVGTTRADTTAEEALVGAQGVCQDHAHIFLAAARLLDVPARYVSGYLKIDDRVEQEAGHAWVEAHVEGLGWVGFDVSNGISPDERYVRVASGCDYAEAAPISSMALGSGHSSLAVELAVDQRQVMQ